MSQINDLASKIKEYSQLYYEGVPQISDDEFDELIEQLKALDPNNEILHKTGWGMNVPDNERKFKHKYSKVIGIEDKISPSELRKKLSLLNIPNNTKIIITPKFDGISVLLYYEKGKFIRALTRGDGEYGIDITDKVIDKIPNELPDKFTGRVRGEFICSIQTWDQFYAKDNKSARNFGGGLLSKIHNVNKEDIDRFDIVVYDLLYDTIPLSYSEQLNLLHGFKFNNISPFYIRYEQDFNIFTESNCIDNASEMLNDLCSKYECDGLVFNVEALDKRFAVKWNIETKTTEVLDVKWQFSRLGKLTPVVYITPVTLCGAVIQKTTGFNYQYIKENCIGKGSNITVCRSGAVIPYIVKVNSKSNFLNIPQTCPYCGSDLEVDGVNLICTNKNCEGYSSNNLLYFLNTVSPIDGLGDKLLQNFINHFKLKTVIDFLTFIKNYDNDFELIRYCKLTNGLGNSAFKKFKKLIDIYKNTSLDLKRLFCGLGLPALSTKTVDKLFDLFDYETLMYQLKHSQISIIPGVNYVALKSLYDNQGYIEQVIGLLNYVPYVLKQTKEPNIIYDIGIAVTGSLSCSRRAFFEECKSVGIREVSIAKAEILVTNDTSTGTTKIREAEKRGTKIMSEEEFRKEYLS